MYISLLCPYHSGWKSSSLVLTSPHATDGMTEAHEEIKSQPHTLNLGLLVLSQDVGVVQNTALQLDDSLSI